MGITENLIMSAIARGYTTKENSSKETDVILMQAMVEEIMMVFDKELPETVVLAYENFPKSKTIEELLDALLRERDSRGR